MPDSTRASGHAERRAALATLDRLSTVSPITLAADRGFGARDFVMELRGRGVIQASARTPAAGARRPAMVRAGGVRKRIEEAFAWIKAIAGSVQDQDARRRAGALVVHARGRR
jgi:hypothetical protein